MDLARLLKSVGQRTFVEYYHLFADSNLSSQEVVDRLPERFTLKARRSKTSHARRLLADGLAVQALEVIAASTRAGNEGTAHAAQEILAQRRYVDATLAPVASEMLETEDFQEDEAFVSIVRLLDATGIDETRLSEITDRTVIARITQVFPAVVETAARTAANSALKNMEVYRAVLRNGETLAKSKAMEGAYRGFARAGEDFSSKFSSHAHFVKVDPSEAVAVAFSAGLASVMNVASLVVGQYYMSQVNSRLEALNESVNSLGDFNEAEFKSRIVSLISHVGEISQFSSTILEDDALRNTKQQTLDNLRLVATDLLGQVNEMIDITTRKSRKPNPNLSDYTDRIRKVEVLMGYQVALLAVLGEISELTYLLGKGSIPSEMSHRQFGRYLQQCVQTNTRLGEWHNRQVKRLDIDLVQERKSEPGRYLALLAVSLTATVVIRTPIPIPAGVGYTRLKQGIAREIRAQSSPVLESRTDLKEVYDADVEIIIKDGKLFYLHESPASDVKCA